MNESLDDLLLDYYQRELTYLRHASTSFAQRYPKIARRLELGPGESGDPHVERLIESFAVLTARLQRTLDDEYSELTDALLEQFYPYASRPLPSMSIVQLEADPTQGSVAAGYPVPRDTPLLHVTADGATVHWRTSSHVTLWPIALDAAHMLSAEEAQTVTQDPTLHAALRLSLRCTGKHTFDTLPIKRLRVHLAGSPVTAATLYDLLCAHGAKAFIQLPGKAARPLIGKPEPAGFSDDEALLPLEDGVHPAYRLLVEYFSFAEKFAFFDLPFEQLPDAGERLDLLIGLSAAPAGRLTVHPHDFAFGCTPALNLFSRTSEPLRPDGTQREMRLIPDAHRETSTEIYAVRKVRTVSGGEVSEVPPYFSFQHASGSKLYWHARRVTGMHRSRPGSDIMLTFVDAQFDPTVPIERTLTAELLCTNRDVAQKLEPGAALSFEAPGPVASVRLLRRPTRQTFATLDGSSRWRLASQMVLNHAPLVEGPHALQALREMLELHNLAASPGALRQISGLVRVSSEPIVAHVGGDLWRGWRNGLKVSVELDNSHFVGTSPVMFSGVLAHFFSLYASVNRFVHTTLMRDGKEIHGWQPMQGKPLVL
jgi:type VI secretion system protein ImpG